MPVNRNALIRYKTIDKCLRNRYRKWTLDDLIEECSEALFEYEGIDKGVSRRTIQLDIQQMRSDKLGYNAPIIVEEKKYYTYEDPEYSITNIPLTDKDLGRLSEVVHILKQFKGFSHFSEVDSMVQKLEDKVYAAQNQTEPVIDFEKNDNLKGLDLLDRLYESIIKKESLEITYQSFKAKKPGTFPFHPFLLKEYRNRWFLLGIRDETSPILNLAVDRIQKIDVGKFPYLVERKHEVKDFFKDVIGVTVDNVRPMDVKLHIDKSNAPYIITKPLHTSQKIISQDNTGIIVEIKVKPNFELEREILGFGENIKVLQPERLKKRIAYRLEKARDVYNAAEEKTDNL
ncbi:helix-turn-helix transcriptional regulator [Chondrinema litorale]|uniref:helix-turn-helix transcriptional regulator n=1 Tax=Chondrinema litorale TaxID=2994555 RepID=UPI002543C323|nr:WYL domain-containing protein [Chondrinema litorale]UZR95687.1 WYL domain-containing protein [Chondrinema litorale]